MCTWRRLTVLLIARLRPRGRAGAAIAGGTLHGGARTLSVGGEITVTAGSRDDSAFFNYTDYEHNALRTFRVSLSAMWQPARWLAIVAELRSEDAQRVRRTPLRAGAAVADRAIEIQAGRIPPVFGAFGRRTYANDNPFIGYPLGYQYLTSLRSDAVPATADDLLLMRARGWRASYPIGEPLADPACRS